MDPCLRAATFGQNIALPSLGSDLLEEQQFKQFGIWMEMAAQWEEEWHRRGKNNFIEITEPL